MAEEVKKEKKRRDIGTVRLSSNELPEIKDWKIGEEYEVRIKVKMTGINQIDSWQLDSYSNLSKDDVFANFDIVDVVSEQKELEKATEKQFKQGEIKPRIGYKK